MPSLKKNIPLSRGVIDIFGSDIPWLVMANNNDERKEKARRMSVVFVLLFLSPIALLPIFNRIGMKYGAKLTKSFWSNNHKAIHLSNKDLKSAENTKKALTKLSTNYENSPLETVWNKITNKKDNHPTLDFSEMLKNCGGDYEKLRKKIINTKNGVMSADYLFSSVALGSVGFINNEITKKKSGKSGFSAEFNMAGKEIVEKRADDYEKTKKYRFAAMLGTSLALAIGVPAAVRRGMIGKHAGKFSEFMKKNSHRFDYTKGIYMSRWSLLLGNVIVCHGGALLANRNNTELKDNALRFGMADALFFGGDIVVGSALGVLSDKFLKTDMIDKKSQNIKRVLPKLKYISDMSNNRDKKIATGLYWLNLAIIAASMGFGVPALANAITKKDINKELKKLKTVNPPLSNFNQVDSKAFEKFINRE